MGSITFFIPACFFGTTLLFAGYGWMDEAWMGEMADWTKHITDMCGDVCTYRWDGRGSMGQGESVHARRKHTCCLRSFRRMAERT